MTAAQAGKYLWGLQDARIVAMRWFWLQGKLRELLSMVSDAAKRKQVLDQYGEWLAQRNMHEDAAVAFLAASNLPAALAEYQQGNHWQMALAVAGEPIHRCGRFHT